MTRQDEIALKAVRASTLKSINEKRKSRIRQIKEECEKKIQEINIQYSEDPERLRAKYAADEYARSEKARIKAEKNIAKEKARIEKQKKIRKLTLGEEIFSSIIQGIGACLFIAGTAVLTVLVYPKLEDVKNDSFTWLYLLFYSLFGGSMILQFIFSTLSHALKPERAKEVFNRLSHIFAFLIIATAYTAYTLKAFMAQPNVLGLVMMGIVWAVCLTGIMLYAIAGSRFELVHMIFYLVMGWAGLAIVNQVYNVLSTRSFYMLLTSGLVYSVGIVFYRLRKIKFFRSIGDLVFLFASILLFFSIFFINDEVLNILGVM